MKYYTCGHKDYCTDYWDNEVTTYPDYWNPTFQTRFGKDGNCFEACVASLFPVNIDRIPDDEWANKDDWHEIFSRWLLERFGYISFCLGIENEEQLSTFQNYCTEGIKVLCSINTSHSANRHAVIINHTGRIIHDPEGAAYQGKRISVQDAPAVFLFVPVCRTAYKVTA